jgi:hypothetical protein
VALLLANALLLVLGAAALWRLLRSAFPDEEHRVGRSLVIGAFLVHPILLAAVVQPGLDFGLLVFSLCALAAAVEGRRWTLVIFGVLLIFSKEPGVVLYGAIAAVWVWRRVSGLLSPDDSMRLGIAALIFLGFLSLISHDTPSALFSLAAAGVVARRRRQPALPPGKGLASALLREWPLVIPVLLLGGYMLYYSLRTSAVPRECRAAGRLGRGWDGARRDAAPRRHLRSTDQFRAAAHVRRRVPLGAVGSGCWWIWPSGACVTRGTCPPRPLLGGDRSALAFIIVVLLTDVWFLTRYVTYSNARYYLPVFPLALIAAYAALVRLQVPALGREILLVAVTVLLGGSTVRMVDPVSRAIWERSTSGTAHS